MREIRFREVKESRRYQDTNNSIISYKNQNIAEQIYKDF